MSWTHRIDGSALLRPALGLALPGWARHSAGGLLVDVRVTPKANRDGLAGIHRSADGAERLSVKVRAAPDKGGANAAVIKTVSAAARCPKSAVSIVSGDKSRLKTLALAGDPDEHLETIRSVVSGASS